MKKMRKIFAVLLTLAMVLAMSIPTFAAASQTATASITVKNVNGANLKYVKVVEANQNSTYGWKFVNGYANAFRTAFKLNKADSDDVAIAKLIELGQLENNNPNTNAETGKTNTGAIGKEELASQFAEALRTTPISGNGVIANNDNYTLVDKAASAGLYVIKAEKTGYSYSDMAAYVAFADNATGTLRDAVVIAKGTKNQVKKEIDKVKVEGQEVDDQNTSITTGDVINYTITQSYPYYPVNATERTFVIEDEITNATFNTNSLNVKANNTGLVKDTDYAVEFSNENKKMKITFNYDSAKAGQTVTVKYSVTVGDISNLDGEDAKVINGAKATANGKYTVAKVEAAPVTFTVKKVDAADNKENKTGLEGAEFQLYIASAEGVKDAVKLTLNDKNNTEVWALSLGNNQKKTTAADGTATFKGLDADKTYFVLETKAPAGFSLNDKAIQLTGASVTMGATTSRDVKAEDGITVLYTEETTPVSDVTDFNSEEYTDTKLSALPSTGGIGTTIFTIAGCLIMVTAAGLFFASRKKSNK
ncbi:SpaA isopeptide-forming pilin-related protein [Blautia glucerasea]|uniref:SpaA isopeptide-forming pilin-related protein n=1 Tax=Blautia glucerasea TaxID=536633 RepID=UPI001D0844CB|nr:SpaA isopeptide-forming pilin-related protein [Blautia glucerasea]MCB6546593.1 LPXTG cell wall anchor domain-containing protein [Blautia glucerasea]